RRHDPWLPGGAAPNPPTVTELRRKEMVVLGFSTTLALGLYRKRSAVIRAEVRFVNGDEAKKLVTEEGFTILDVRDRIQYERARITSCCHVPLFVENQDNDFGMHPHELRCSRSARL
ncbi:hypothetical protein BHM03_00024352, partial [Ensete ventricosum]